MNFGLQQTPVTVAGILKCGKSGCQICDRKPIAGKRQNHNVIPALRRGGVTLEPRDTIMGYQLFDITLPKGTYIGLMPTRSRHRLRLPNGQWFEVVDGPGGKDFFIEVESSGLSVKELSRRWRCMRVRRRRELLSRVYPQSAAGTLRLAKNPDRAFLDEMLPVNRLLVLERELAQLAS